MVCKVIQRLQNLRMSGGIGPFVHTPYWCAEGTTILVPLLTIRCGENLRFIMFFFLFD